MAYVGIRDVPEWIHKELKKAANEDRRSINQYMQIHLEEWARRRLEERGDKPPN